MIHCNISDARGKTSVEILLERKFRLPTIADLDWSEPILFKCNDLYQEGALLHTTWKLNLNYFNEWQSNCETRWGECENWKTCAGDHISFRTKISEHRCGTFTSRQASAAISSLEQQQLKSSDSARIFTVFSIKVSENKRNNLHDELFCCVDK